MHERGHKPAGDRIAQTSAEAVVLMHECRMLSAPGFPAIRLSDLCIKLNIRLA